MVIATQNPIEYEGTYPLPEAQLDRFTMRLALGYPPLADEARMLAEQTTEPPLERAAPGRREPPGHADQRSTRRRAIFVEESLNRYVVALLRHTRASSRLALGASPRVGHRAAARGEGAGARGGPRLRPARGREGGRRRRCSPTG